MMKPSPLLPAAPRAYRPLLPRLQETCYQVLPGLPPPSRQPGFRHKPHPPTDQNGRQVAALSRDMGPLAAPPPPPGWKQEALDQDAGVPLLGLLLPCVTYSQGGKRVITVPITVPRLLPAPIPVVAPLLGVVREADLLTEARGTHSDSCLHGTNP